MRLLLCLLLLFVAAGFAVPLSPPKPGGAIGNVGIPVSINTRGIGGSNSSLVLTRAETVMFEYTDGPGVMTYFWMTGGWPGFNRTRVRYYVDGNLDIEFDYYQSIGIGFGDQNVWGTALVGKGAVDGSVYFTYQIPFRKSVIITVQLPSDIESAAGFYFVCRGLTNVGVSIGRYALPETARLKLYKQEKVKMQPLDYLNVYTSPPGVNGGAVLGIFLTVNSGNYNFLEGCFRAFVPPSATDVSYLLASGTEDYFQSGWYFNGGPFHFPGAGTTHLDGQHEVSVYKFHTDDPLFFDRQGFRMTWRNGDTNNAQGQKCQLLQGGVPVGSPQPSIVTTYAWVYEW